MTTLFNKDIRLYRIRILMLLLLQFVGATGGGEAFGQVTESRGVQYVAVTLGSKTIRTTLANTHQLRVEGLLGWSSINDDSGMLLDFMADGVYAIHMQGMKFPIDAIWIDSSDRIRLIYENIKPDSGMTYPSMFPSKYCLEVNSGFCKRHNVRSGQKIVLGVWPPKN